MSKEVDVPPDFHSSASFASLALLASTAFFSYSSAYILSIASSSSVSRNGHKAFIETGLAVVLMMKQIERGEVYERPKGYPPRSRPFSLALLPSLRFRLWVPLLYSLVLCSMFRVEDSGKLIRGTRSLSGGVGRSRMLRQGMC